MRRAMSRAFTEVIALESAGNGDRGYECPQGATSIPPHRHLLVVVIGPTGPSLKLARIPRPRFAARAVFG